MKIRGKKIETPKPLMFAIPRSNEKGEPEDIIFTVGAVTDYSEFEQLCPRPKPPLKTMPGHEPVELLDDPRYIDRLNKYYAYKHCYLILKSLSLTEGLEWSSVDMSKPDTWENYEAEMQEVFTEREYLTIMNHVGRVNAPSADRQKEALERFFRERQSQDTHTTISSSQQGEQPSTTSGEPVKG